MARLVRESAVLEPNSTYAYVLLCTDFRQTCFVADRGGPPLAFVAAYRPPTRPDTVFVWQIGVHPDERGRGLGTRLLRTLLSAPGARDACWLEATITPSNVASLGLFSGLARSLDASFELGPGFPGDLFGEASVHEPEQRCRIGPLMRREA